MIPRHLSQELLRQLGEYPIVTVLGPRQAGKTTLTRALLKDYQYVSLETPDILDFAFEDPRAFLTRYSNKIIFDEIQRAPHLINYLQGIVDESNRAGQFVLTGSHQLELRAAITQSLAGRTGILNLLPFSISELQDVDITFDSFEEYIFTGFLPRIFDQNQRPNVAYSNYFQTYVERDVRQIIRLKDATLFNKFIRLLAGRTGQIINYQSLSSDVGVDAKTIKEWLSILEASFVVFKLTPYFENFGKRVIKSPKYYFTDTGLLTYLLGIEKPEQVCRDPLVGQLFENLVVLEALKARYNQGRPPNLYFYRDSHGNEIDLLCAFGRELIGIEVKSASTFHHSYKKMLLQFSKKQHALKKSYVVYSGEGMVFSDGIEVVNFKDLSAVVDFGQL
ncbi:MAG: ATP-binding protein [Gammaproteobacteria bacterium]|nr:ATP-binding protein [Gammaproteobacteria bacterium]